MLMLGPGARRPFPGRDHRPPVTRQPEVPAELHPVVARSDFKTRQTVSRVTRGMVRQAVAAGRETSRHRRETTMAPSHGVINASRQDKGPLDLSPRRRDLNGCHARAAHAFRRQSGGQCMPGQGGLRFRPPAQGSWRPGWRSSSGDRGDQPPVQQQQYPSGQRRWSQGSADQPPPGTVNTPPLRRRRCYVCGQPGCHSDFHREGAVSAGTTSHHMFCLWTAWLSFFPPSEV